MALTLDESDNVETEPYLQAVREVLDDKFENVITLCTAEIDKPGKIVGNHLLAFHTVDETMFESSNPSKHLLISARNRNIQYMYKISKLCVAIFSTLYILCYIHLFENNFAILL